MRRTANLSLFAEEKKNNLANVDHLFSVNKKCTIELGIVNTVPNYVQKLQTQDNTIPQFKTINYQEKYGDIVWFPLGLYVMFNPSIAHDLNGVTISMQLKDKMCLLNGQLGGEIHSAVDFNYQDQLVDENIESLEKNPVLIYNIIKELVNHWGNENLSKIIISQVPFQIKSVVKWSGSDNIYLVERLTNPMLFTSYEQAEENAQPQGDETQPCIIKTIEPGYDVGYVYTDFVYPGELSCNAGETVTSVLDKIIGVIGNYEYFYDVEGNFIFQEKANYLNMTYTAYWVKEEAVGMQNNQVSNQTFSVGELPSEVYEADPYKLSKPVYNFVHNQYTTAYNNTLNYNNIKNDFVVWGSYPSGNSNYRIPCRFHLAIDKKPTLNSHKWIGFYKDDFNVVRGIYMWGKHTKGQMVPLTYASSILVELIEDAREITCVDWREEIYYQMLKDEYWLGANTNTELNNTYFQYYAELKEEFPKIFDLQTQTYKEDMELHPDRINYYLDFIDEDSELGQYSVSNIGRRAKIIGDNNQGINCVFQPTIPDIVYIDTTKYTIDELVALREKLIRQGQYFTQVPSEISALFTIGGSLNSCYEKIKDLLYQYTHVNNTISITTLPIYYLEPNTRITVEDQPAGIYDDYIIQSISLPLDVSSTMSINAYKALQKI